MGWSVDEDGIGPFIAQTIGSSLAAMSGAVVHDPKDTASGLVGLMAHDFADEPIHGSDSALDFAATKNLRLMDIPELTGPSMRLPELAGSLFGCFLRYAQKRRPPWSLRAFTTVWRSFIRKRISHLKNLRSYCTANATTAPPETPATYCLPDLPV